MIAYILIKIIILVKILYVCAKKKDVTDALNLLIKTYFLSSFMRPGKATTKPARTNKIPPITQPAPI